MPPTIGGKFENKLADKNKIVSMIDKLEKRNIIQEQSG